MEAFHEKTTLSLPSDLYESIVDHVGAIGDPRVRWQALSALALASRTFRYLSRMHLFNEITVSVSHGNVRLQKLCDIVDHDPDTEAAGIASYIRRFSLYPQGNDQDPQDGSYDRLVIYLLRRIFRGTRRLSEERMLSLKLFNWASMSEELKLALEELFTNSLLSSLLLKDALNFPVAMVMRSNIKNLAFTSSCYETIIWKPITPATDATTILSNSRPRCQLSSLSVGRSFTTPTALHSVILPLYPILSYLRTLTARLCTPWELNALEEALVDVITSLENLNLILTLHFSEAWDANFEARGLAKLYRLKRLSICIDGANFGTQAYKHVMTTLLASENRPPSLQAIELDSHFIPARRLDRKPHEIFPPEYTKDFCVLDSLICHSDFTTAKTFKFVLIIRIAIRLSKDEYFAETKFTEDCRFYVQKRFPIMESLSNLLWDIKIIPQVRSRASNWFFRY